MRCAIICDAQMRSLGLTEATARDNLTSVSALLLSMLATSASTASICLAFCEGATAVARTLRAERCLAVAGARANVLAAAARLAALDGNACQALLEQGMFATVEQHLFVRTPLVLQLSTSVRRARGAAC